MSALSSDMRIELRLTKMRWQESLRIDLKDLLKKKKLLKLNTKPNVRSLRKSKSVLLASLLQVRQRKQFYSKNSPTLSQSVKS